MPTSEDIYNAAKENDVDVLKKYTGKLDDYYMYARTALMDAAYYGNFPALKCLLENGAALNHTNKDGENAYDCAKKNGKNKMATYLRQLEENDWMPCSDHEVDYISYLTNEGFQIKDRFNLRSEERTRYKTNLMENKVTAVITKFSDIANAELQVAAEKLEEFTGEKTYSNIRQYRPSMRKKQSM